ncbi:conserved hypothetical protein [Histoplasma capsulatum G186AR]|uniref:Restriction of telomere capping protein 4 n=2 Tax=Ajellomyces capsulatus TaxID=5037 RepID=C0NBN6_AJECG|nr:uncharacterized protein HCBG_00532 [Histoplasma capsulatum G186AR]EEH11077.1 conserved hypothetical protein [Histoplasma capsulatum G186AR]KAG5303071.1 hypothetical protein I7I52_00948 [Histoplasma capsulatum]QSS71527.1 hypothetical protein I7I50_02388 [Histoplasma capsulatum G186AR]
MVSRRPDSSYASNLQTKHNYRGGAPLSQAGGRLINHRESVSGHSASTSRKNKPEPATDDEPLSSTDESEQLNTHSEVSLSPEPEPRRKSNGWSQTETTGRLDKQPQSEADIRGEDDKRNPKRRKKAVDTPRKREKQSGKMKFSPPASSKETPRRPTFKMESDALFSCPRPPPMKSFYGSANLHTALKKKPSKQFKVPLSTADEDSAIHSSQISSDGPKFKTPLSFPNEVTSSSSFFNGTSPFDDDDDGSSLSSLSSVSSSVSLQLSQAEKQALESATLRAKAIICPMCDQAVDPRFIDELRSNQGLSYRKKAQFCRDHRIKAAKHQWTERGYPKIDWENLHKRIEKHYAELDEILTRKKPSFYRNVLESSRTGKKKGSLRLTVDGDGVEKISPGYYGPWGAKAMMDAIIGHFAGKFKRLAPTDTLIKAAGVSGFVQSVMVPELTVMLVKDDMDIEDADARQVMRDSTEIGNLINEQPDDIIKQAVRI